MHFVDTDTVSSIRICDMLFFAENSYRKFIYHLLLVDQQSTKLETFKKMAQKFVFEVVFPVTQGFWNGHLLDRDICREINSYKII